MATTNSSLAFMAGDARDTLYLGPAGTDLSSITGLNTAVPAELVGVGWISEDGMTLGLSDSVDKIRGHQDHGVVRTYMSESSTTFQASLLETKLELLKPYLGVTKVEKVTDGAGSVTKLAVKASRKVERLAGVADLYDVSTGKHRRYIFPILELGERSDVVYQNGELTVYEYNLEVIDGYTMFSDEDGLKVA